MHIYKQLKQTQEDEEKKKELERRRRRRGRRRSRVIILQCQCFIELAIVVLPERVVVIKLAPPFSAAELGWAPLLMWLAFPLPFNVCEICAAPEFLDRIALDEEAISFTFEWDRRAPYFLFSVAGVWSEPVLSEAPSSSSCCSPSFVAPISFSEPTLFYRLVCIVSPSIILPVFLANLDDR